MKNEGFRLAVRFAQADYQITPQQVDFWKSAYFKMSDEIQAIQEEAKAKKRRRPRRRRDKDGERGRSAKDSGADSTDDLDDESDDLDLDTELGNGLDEDVSIRDASPDRADEDEDRRSPEPPTAFGTDKP